MSLGRRPILTAGALAAPLALLAACDFGATRSRPGSEGEPRREAGSAEDLAARMVERGRLPQLDYDCRLIGADEGADRPYGRLGIVNDRYTLILKGGGRQEGEMTLRENRAIAWEGDLGAIDDQPRRVTRARLNTQGSTVEAAFDFRPADDAGHDQVVCRAEAPAN